MLEQTFQRAETFQQPVNADDRCSNPGHARQLNGYCIYVTSFSSNPYYSNVRLISKLYLEQNSRSITLDIQASTVERPPYLFRFKQHSANKLLKNKYMSPFSGDL